MTAKREEKSLQPSDVSILSAHEVEPHLLTDFYHAAYPEHKNWRPRVWRWLYRTSFYDDAIPLIMLHEGRVIAHAGMIPFQVLFQNSSHTASWFVDFAVLPAYQRQGLGIALTKRWMAFSDLYVTFCNEKSMGVFEKYGWAQSFDTYLHYYLLQPFDHPTLARLVPPFLHTPLNTLTAPMLRGVYHRHALALDALHVQPLDRKTLPTYTVHPSDPRVVLPTRDEAYVDWRLLQSPDREKYRMVSLREGDLHVVAKLCSEPVRHVDVLWISPLTKRDAIRETLAKMALWAMERDFAYLRAYYSIEELSDYLQRSLRPVVRHPRFAFYSRDDELFTALRDARWRWQLIDSDFEER